MNHLTANLWNETEKIWRRTRTKAFLLLTLILPVLSAILFSLLQNRIGVNVGLGDNLPLLMLWLFTFAILPLFLFMTVSESFSGEVAAHTLKLSLVRPITRTKVFVSKITAIAVYLIVFLAALMIVSVIVGSFVPGGNLIGSLLDIVKAYVAAFVPMLAIALIAVFIAQFFHNSTGALTLSILIYAAAKLIVILFPKVSLWSIFSYTNWYILWIGYGASFAKLINTFVLLLSYCIMAFSAGLLLFEKKQL